MSVADYQAQAIKNTAPTYLKGAIDNTVREWYLFKFIENAGKVKKKFGGYDTNWLIKAKRPGIYTTRGERPQFVESDLNESLTISRARMEGVDKISRDTLSVNRGESQIYDLSEKKVDELVESMVEAMGHAVYQDASADDSLVAGMDTVFQGTVTADTDKVAVPSSGSTYGGKSMVLGALGGNWTANLAAAERFNSGLTNDWPEGSGDPQYDYLASKMFNYTGNWTPGVTNTWGVNAEKIMRRSAVSINALGGTGSAPAVHVLARGMYMDWQDNLTHRERLSIDDYSKSLGFSGVMNFEGAAVAWDYACPADSGYGINPKYIELSSNYDDLFFIDGPTWDITEQAYLMLVGFHGNFRWNPKYMAKYASFTA